MFNDIINICIACDDNYAKHAGVLIASVLKNANEDDKLAFYILDGGISEDKIEKIRSLTKIKDATINFIKINDDLFEDYKAIKTHSYISLPSYYRLKLSSLLTNINRVIYFDCDIIVNSSLKELFNSDLNSNPIAGVKDIDKRKLKKNPTYINSGMVVMDLEKIRTNNIETKFLEWTANNIERIKTGDQEILNEVCKNQVTILDDTWNVQSSNFTNRSSYTNNPKVIHFVAKLKPWHFGSLSYHKFYYFKYLQLTPWALQNEELDYWYKKNQFASLINYVKYRPFFLLRPRFYKAIFYTYVLPVFNINK